MAKFVAGFVRIRRRAQPSEQFVSSHKKHKELQKEEVLVTSVFVNSCASGGYEFPELVAVVDNLTHIFRE